MSLSRWLRDYLYIPLGGSRCSKVTTYRNLFITMGLGGLWHGANWTFVVWGLIQGLYLCLHRLGNFLKINRWIAAPIAVLLTYHAMCVSWVFFRAQSFPEAAHFLSAMFNPLVFKSITFPEGAHLEASQSMMTTETALLIIVLFFLGHGLVRYFKPQLKNVFMKEAILASAYCAFLYFVFTLAGSQPQQFIYFQF
jgi:alginate O-acetyltransferase complex protein AlgI